MSRQTRGGGPYITPLKSDGTEAVAAGARGSFTLTSGTTYLFMLGGPDAPIVSAHFIWDAAIILTSLTVEDSNFSESEVSNFSTTAAEWIDEDPSTAFVGTVGAGVTVTNGVVAVAGGAAGGCMFHVADTGAYRTRVRVVVGGTGGVMRACSFGKM